LTRVVEPHPCSAGQMSSFQCAVHATRVHDHASAQQQSTSRALPLHLAAASAMISTGCSKKHGTKLLSMSSPDMSQHFSHFRCDGNFNDHSVAVCLQSLSEKTLKFI